MKNRELGNERKPETVICNQCGRKITPRGEAAREEVCEVRQRWGYFSDKDGETHSFVLCETCYDKLVKGFQVPVKIEAETELV